MDRSEILGVYFGYPDCCIEEFVAFQDDLGRKQSIQMDPKVHQHTGFIPCVKHCRQIKTGRLELEDLITNRVCRSRFPNQGSWEEAEAYVDKIMKHEKRDKTLTVGDIRTAAGVGKLGRALKQPAPTKGRFF